MNTERLILGLVVFAGLAILVAMFIAAASNTR
jgi:hypothetical protein